MKNNKSIQRYLHIVRVLSLLLGLLQLGYFLLSWLFPDTLRFGGVFVSFYPRGMQAGAVADLAPAMRWVGILIALPALLVLGYALFRLDRMLDACAKGRMFALATVAHMKTFVGCVLASLALTIVEPALRNLAWRSGFDSAPQPFNLAVSGEELTLLLVCALFFVVASMMHEARRIAEENEGFV